MKEGDRVCCIFSADSDNVVGLIGYGTYQGEKPLPDIIKDALPQLEAYNPCILLDDKVTTVWGFECWWGPEEMVIAKFKLKDPDTNIAHVDIVRERAKMLVAVMKAKSAEAEPTSLSEGLLDYIKEAVPVVKAVAKAFAA